MTFKDIYVNYRLSIKHRVGSQQILSIRKWYRAGEELRPGFPGMELSHEQFQHLTWLKDRLEDMAGRGIDAQCLLGGNRQVVVKNGSITLWRLPTVLGPVVALRHALTLPPQLWRELWQHREWALAELSSLQDATPDTSPQPAPTPTTTWADTDSWWLGNYPDDPEELKEWAAGLTHDQLMACPDRQPAPWDDFWGAWQAVLTEIHKRAALPQPATTSTESAPPPKKKRMRKEKDT